MVVSSCVDIGLAIWGSKQSPRQCSQETNNRLIEIYEYNKTLFISIYLLTMANIQRYKHQSMNHIHAVRIIYDL